MEALPGECHRRPASVVAVRCLLTRRIAGTAVTLILQQPLVIRQSEHRICPGETLLLNHKPLTGRTSFRGRSGVSHPYNPSNLLNPHLAISITRPLCRSNHFPASHRVHRILICSLVQRVNLLSLQVQIMAMALLIMARPVLSVQQILTAWHSLPVQITTVSAQTLLHNRVSMLLPRHQPYRVGYRLAA